MTIKEVNTSIPPNTAEDAPKRITMVARKDFRDRFESERENHEKMLSDTLGGSWTIKLDPGNLFTYLRVKDEDVFGFYCNKYFAEAKQRLQGFAEEYGDDGKARVGKLAHTRIVTIEPDSAKAAESGTVDFTDGKFRILFAPDGFTRCASYWFSGLGEIVSKAEASGPTSSTGGKKEMSLIARRDVRDRFDPEIGKLLERAQKYLQCPELAFDANLADNYAFLAAWGEELKTDPDERAIGKLDKDWEKYFGYYSLRYFTAFTDWLRDNEFHKDDMLRDGFKDVVSANKVELRQVEDSVFKDAKGYDADAVIEDGVLVLRTTRQRYGRNEGVALRDLMSQL